MAESGMVVEWQPHIPHFPWHDSVWWQLDHALVVLFDLLVLVLVVGVGFLEHLGFMNCKFRNPEFLKTPSLHCIPLGSASWPG